MERPPWEKQSILNEAIARGGHLGLARHALGSIGRVLSAPINAFRTRMPSDAAIMDKVDRAEAIFDPGTPDPYMIFDHKVRPQWVDRIPAVVHLDGTARLQTVTAEQNPLVAELLTEYEKLSGIPMLCNTSANHLGKGFFPDVSSAADWDGVDAIWSDDTLYRKAARRG